MLKAKVNIQVLKVDRRLITLFKPFFRGKEIQSSEMNSFFKILDRIASYGPQIDQSHGKNRLSHIIRAIIPCSPNMVTIRVCSELKTSGNRLFLQIKSGRILDILWAFSIKQLFQPTRRYAPRGIIVNKRKSVTLSSRRDTTSSMNSSSFSTTQNLEKKQIARHEGRSPIK